jgi:hypothetical protein
MKINWLFSAAGLVFAAGVIVLVVAERKRKAAAPGKNQVSVADEAAAQVAKAAPQHIDVDYVGGVVH